MRKNLFLVTASIIFLSFIFFQLNCSQKSEQKTMTKDEQIAKGKYLVNLGGCNHCHSPKLMTEMGPIPDTTKLLSGHPADEPLGELNKELLSKGQWVLAGMDFTSFVGPWGVSYAANITPDNETGLGTWTEDLFIKALRSGKHMGVGRPILPPMPWMDFAKCTDEDLKCIFAYLHSIPAIHNQVPDAIPPDKIASLFQK